MNKPVGIDATDVYCPEFTTPVLSLIKKLVKPGQSAVIKTREERAFKRLQHICASHDWTVIAYMEKNSIYFIQIKI